MSTSSFPIGTSRRNEVPLSVSRRLIWIAIACAIQMIYIPTSNRVAGGIEPKLSIDIFPIWSIWVVPYVLCYVLWLSSIAWLIFKVEDRSFRAFIAACILTFALGAATFIFFPTYVPAATLDGNDIFTGLLRTIHETWGRYDAFPSGHVYITTLLTLFYGRWYPQYKYFWLLILVIVSFSTLFTAQHYILDVLGGYLAGLAGYHFGLWWAGFYSAEKQPSKATRKRMTSSPLN